MIEYDYREIGDIELFLNGIKNVTSLTEGALKYNGATFHKGQVYSNYFMNNNIIIQDGLNALSLFVPSTVNVNESIDNRPYVISYFTALYNRFIGINNGVQHSVGSYYSEDLDEVIIEDVTVITFYFQREINLDEIKFFKDLALRVKKEMTQESVSFCVNGSLCLV